MKDRQGERTIQSKPKRKKLNELNFLNILLFLLRHNKYAFNKPLNGVADEPQAEAACEPKTLRFHPQVRRVLVNVRSKL